MSILPYGILIFLLLGVVCATIYNGKNTTLVNDDDIFDELEAEAEEFGYGDDDVEDEDVDDDGDNVDVDFYRVSSRIELQTICLMSKAMELEVGPINFIFNHRFVKGVIEKLSLIDKFPDACMKHLHKFRHDEEIAKALYKVNLDLIDMVNKEINDRANSKYYRP